MPKQQKYQYFADVILPLAIPNLFTYAIPEEWSDKVSLGVRVEVQFGKKKLYAAIVRNIHQDQPENYRVKPIITVLDKQPIVSRTQLKFWDWLAEYYMCHIGEVMHAALPSGLKLASETIIFLNPQYEQAYPNKKLTKNERLVLEVLRDRQSIAVSKLQRLVELNTVYPLVQSLLEKDIVAIKEAIRSVYKPKTIPYVKLSNAYQKEEALKSLYQELERAPKQLALVMAHADLGKKQTHIRKKDLLERADSSYGPLKSLVERGVFEIEEREVGRLADDDLPEPGSFNLTKIQKAAYNSMKAQFEEKEAVLLHGVTSSGKTHLYIRLIEEKLEQGKQVLYLLPEIALTAQIINRLRHHFGNDIGVYHSRFNPSERVEIWQKVQRKEYKVVLGPRSALFLPFQDLDLVIVDEEHDSAYKQFSPAPRYNARDSAIYLAQLVGAKVVLGTATPSVESWFNARIADKYGYVELRERYGGIQLPEIVLADWRKEKRSKRRSAHFTNLLIEAVQKALEKKEQVILFQNRRGYVPYMECKMCGWTPYCRNCDVSLTHHKYTKELRCHYCGYMMKPPSACPACGSTNIKVQGFGTQKIEEELETHFPEADIGRMDLDTTSQKFGHSKIITDFEDGKLDILVGTQMVTKGLDFDNVSIVGILSAENLLNHPDFRANERAFQLMAQVSGRAGRKKKQGKVIIQTYHPDHPIISYVNDYTYAQFFETELEQRKTFHYPPYYRMVQITLKHKDRVKVDRAAEALGKILKGKYGKQVLGPEYGMIPRLRNQYLKSILIKVNVFKTSVVKQKAEISRVLKKFSTDTRHRAVTIQVDVDPLN